MIVDTAVLGLGLLLLFFGGDGLIRGASELAARAGVSPLAVGLTVVAFGTSAPELVVSLDAALAEASAIAVGNVVGSNIANVGLILGLSALIRPLATKAKILKVDTPLMVVVGLVLVATMLDRSVSRLEGGLLLVALAAYVGFTFWEARRELPDVKEELASQARPPSVSIPSSVLRVVVGLSVLVLGGHLLVGAAVDIATELGVSQAVVGLTIVAVGTSLPELSTSVVATLKGQGEIGIGNAVGSNIFNVLGILGVTAVVHPPSADAITAVDLWTMVGFSAVLVLFLRTRMTLDRVEGGLLLAAYLAYTVWLVAA